MPASQLKKLAGVSGLIVTPNADVKLSGVGKSTQLWPYESGNATLWPGDTTLVRRQDAGDRDRRLGHPEPRRLRQPRHRERQPLDDRRQHLARRRARSRHLRGRHRGGRCSGSDGRRSGSTARLGQGDERPGPGQDVRRHHGGPVDPRQQGRSTTSALRTSRCTRATARTSIVTRSIRQSRSCGSTAWSLSRQPATTASATGPSGVLYAPGNDPFVITVGAVDIGNSLAGERRLGRSVVGLRLHAGRLLQAGRRGSRPLHGRPDPGRLDDRGAARRRTSSAPTGSSCPARRSRHRSSRAPWRRCWPGIRAGRPTRSRARSCARLATSRTATRRLPVSARSRPAARSTATYAPNPNVGLERFVSRRAAAPASSFDAMSWANAAKADMSWNSMSWNSQSWSDLSWSDQSWASMSWADMSWNSMSWTDMSWADMSWADYVAARTRLRATRSTGTAGYAGRPRRHRGGCDRSVDRRPRGRDRPGGGARRQRLRPTAVAPVGRGGQHRQLAPAVGHGAHDRGEGPLRRALAACPHPDGGSVGRAPKWGMRGSPPQP